MFRTLLTAGAVLALVAAFAACGGDDGTKAGSGSPTPSNALSKLFPDPKSMASQELLVQERVRDCMVAQGFQYTPIDPSANGGIQTLDSSSEDFVKENGFGISTFVDGVAFKGAVTSNTDPNSQYVQGLSEADRAAYQKALFGELKPAENSTSDGAEGGFSVSIGGSGEGCLGKANEEVRGKQSFLSDPSFQDKLKEMTNRIAADPRIQKANRDWSACMADAGYHYQDEEAARKDIQDRTKALTGRDPGAGIGGGGARVVVSVGGGPGRDGTVVPTPTPSYDQSALRALQSDEKKLALASLECRKKTTDKVEPAVRREYEEAFARDNADLLGGK